MSHDEDHPTSGIARIVRMANQIGTFFESKPHELGVAGVAEHINKFWEPRMRAHFFNVVDGGGEGLKPIVLEAADKVRRPAAPEGAGLGAGNLANAGGTGGEGVVAGESVGEIAASQG